MPQSRVAIKRGSSPTLGDKKVIPDTCIVIETTKFPILEGEEDELVNEGMYGKALCLYLQNEVPKLGMVAPFFVCEDWGWWIELKDRDFVLGLCVYSDPEAEGDPERYAVMSSITKEQRWSWSHLGKINISDNVQRIMDTVERIFDDDTEIESVSRHNDYPF